MIIHFIIPFKSQTLNLSFTAPPNQFWACRLQSQKVPFTGISTFTFIIDDNEDVSAKEGIHMGRSEHNFVDSVLSCFYVGSRAWTQII